MQNPAPQMITGLDVPCQIEVERALDDARQLYLKTLEGWAIDALRLRSSGDHATAWQAA